MCNYSKSILFAVGLGLSLAAGIATGQPIDPVTATGEYAGGGVVLTGDDLRAIARCEDGSGAARGGGGVGNVLVVECGGAFGFSTIQSAIDAAVDGDVVVVLPNDCSAEGRWFENIDFLGKAIRVQSANPGDAAVVEATVIDGSAAGTVVKFVNGEGAESVLDGVVVTNGNTVGVEAGGGITIRDSQPTIRRCLIRENRASLGGGILSQGSDAANVEHCQFDSNIAAYGSAIGVTGWISVTDCDFQQHESALIVSDFGSPLHCSDGDYCFRFERCRFMENSAGSFVGTGFRICDSEFLNNDSASLSVKWSAIERCVFDGNGPNSNGLIAQTDHVSILDCEFQNNSLRCLHIYWDTNVEDCRFTNNAARVISCYGRNNNFIGCKLENNFSNSVPMELLIAQGNTIRNCDFINNTMSGYGAGALRLGVVQNGFTSDIGNCRFMSNHCNSGPGAILASVADIHDCLFVGNTSESNTSAIAGDVVTISNSTIVGNLSKTLSGAVTGAQITNSIVFNNRDAYGDGHQSQVTQATTATFSNIQNLQYNFTPGGISNALAGNISRDPRFVDPGHWDDNGTPADLSDDVFVPGDYHLLPESPCIDGGDPGFVADVHATDFDGEPRVQSCRVDMGADEFVQDAVDVPGDFDGDGFVTVDDVAAFLDVVLAARGLGVCRADLTGDGFADGRDVALMAGLLLGE